MNCVCLDTGLQFLISSVAIATTTIVAFTGYQVGKNNFLKRKLKKSEKHQESDKKSCEAKLEKVVEIVGNKYENIDDVKVEGNDATADDVTEGRQYDDVAEGDAKSGDVTVAVDDVTAEPSAPTKDAIYADLNKVNISEKYNSEENIYEELGVVRGNTKVEK